MKETILDKLLVVRAGCGSGYFAETAGMIAREDEEARGRWLSSAWAEGRTKKTEAQEVVFDLMKVRQCVHNFLRIYGVPRDTRVGIAMLGQGQRAAAGFDSVENKSAPPFKGPNILLDKTIYDEAEPAEMLDVYLGLALHEAGHLNNTREMFLRLMSGELSGKRRVWEGLFEDERVEDCEKRRSPGCAPYLHTVKRVLFERKEFGFALNNWVKLPDMDRVNIIAFAFIRCPHALTDEHKEWTSVGGTCVYAELRELLKRRVKTEDDVMKAGGAVAALLKRIREEYKDRKEEKKELADGEPDSGTTGDPSDSCDAGKSEGAGDSGGSSEGAGGKPSGGSDGGGDASPEDEARVEKQKEADEQDKADAEKLGEAAGKAITAERWLKRELGDAKKVSETLERGKEDDCEDAADVVAAEARAVAVVFDERTGRFGILDIARMLERLEGVDKPLDLDESKEYAKATEERLSFGADWEHSDIPRRTVVVHPKPDGSAKKRYDAAFNAVRGMVARTKGLFQFRLGTRTFTQRERTEGRLDRMRLARATISERVFRTSYTREDKGIAVCLLLDESGSMGHADSCGDSANIALRIGVLFAAALEKLPGVELEVYSHASCGENHKDCLIKCLYGKANPNLASIGGYSHGYQNYDSMAIAEVGKRFADSIDNENRLMIVLSDGQPAGYRYGGTSARRATRDAVRMVRKKYGIECVQVAIGGYSGCKDMFDHVIAWSDFGKLLGNMRGLLMKVVRKYTNK